MNTATQAQNSEFQSAGKPVAQPYYLVDQYGIPVVPFSAGTQSTEIAAGVATDTVIGYVAASAVAGTIVDSQWPALNGIAVEGNASNPAMTVSWS